MPYPLMLAAAAATAAGTGMQMAGAAQARGAMNDARAAELSRQKRYQDEASAEFSKSLKKSDRATADEQMQAGADRRSAAYQALAASPVGQPLPTRPGSDGAVTDTGTAGAAARTKANATATANAWSRLVGGAQARLGGGEDWQLEQGIKNAEANRNLAITSSNARGSANILPWEMEEASHAGDGLKGWGQLVSALGSVAGIGAATAPGSASGALENPGVATFNPTPVAGYTVADSWAKVPVGWLKPGP